jgi:cleavage and polyadenylation specificity factor subunit 1
MHALHQEILPPSGVEFATSLNLTTSTFKNIATSPNITTRHKSAPRALCNVVVARSNLLRIYEVCEEPAPLPTRDDEERDRRSSFRRGTEAVEGEVEMDEQGEGFVNVGSTVKVIWYICMFSRVSNARSSGLGTETVMT